LKNQVLIVDDEPQMLIALNESLRQFDNISVQTAGSGIEALSKIKQIPYNLIITDMRMPEVSGLDLLREVRNISPSTKVVMVTAYGTVQHAVEAMKLGAVDYLLKPFSVEQLEMVVDKVLASETKHTKEERSGKATAIITQDEKTRQVLEMAQQAAHGRATILIQAESGTGKELLARFIHEKSDRARGPFIAVNCAALPDNLLESELFGYEKGAFTGATAQKPGKFELANEGTILLDEIGEMAPILQAKLLRVLQEREVDRVGGRKPIPIDVRVIATTNRDLAELVKQGQFREDLYYRLNVIPLRLPPLRERQGDIPLLANHFCSQFGREVWGEDVKISPEAMKILTAYSWPGNVRELENVILRAVTLSNSKLLSPCDLRLIEEAASPREKLEAPPDITVDEMEKSLILKTLRETNGNRTHAARKLGISVRTLRNKLRDYRVNGEVC